MGAVRRRQNMLIAANAVLADTLVKKEAQARNHLVDPFNLICAHGARGTECSRGGKNPT